MEGIINKDLLEILERDVIEKCSTNGLLLK